jgi:signal peptidase II
MKKHEWFYVIMPLLFTWFVDRISKHWATGLDHIISFKFMGFVLHHNHGAMLGLFSELPPVLRIVSLSTGGAFLVCTYAIIQYLLPIKSLKLRIGMSFLLGGILGNVTDRIIWGYVVDFIVIGNVNISSPAFNLADALQWVGYGLIVWAIVQESELLWPENDARKRLWVNRKFQLKYCLFLVGIGLSLTLISVVFSYTFLRVTIIELIGNSTLANKFLTPFLVTYVVICFAFCAICFLIGRIISHKIAGPIFAFEKYMESAVDGNYRRFKLREKDEFRELENLAQKLTDELIKSREASGQIVEIDAQQLPLFNVEEIES